MSWTLEYTQNSAGVWGRLLTSTFFFYPLVKYSAFSSELSFLLGAEKSNSPGAQGAIKVLLHAFLPSPRRKKEKPFVRSDRALEVLQ